MVNLSSKKWEGKQYSLGFNALGQLQLCGKDEFCYFGSVGLKSENIVIKDIIEDGGGLTVTGEFKTLAILFDPLIRLNPANANHSASLKNQPDLCSVDSVAITTNTGATSLSYVQNSSKGSRGCRITLDAVGLKRHPHRRAFVLAEQSEPIGFELTVMATTFRGEAPAAAVKIQYGSQLENDIQRSEELLYDAQRLVRTLGSYKK